MALNRVMIAGMKSGCGKTTLTCGILRMLVNRGLQVASLKCGPDYIDPMFHEKVIGVRSGNLDGYFCEDDVLSTLLGKHAKGKDITVLEGVMGYYDGVGMTSEGGSCHVSMATKTPVILVVDCKGMGASIGAILHGFLTYQENQIQGVIFNQLPMKLYEEVKKIALGMGIKVFGYVPTMKEIRLESRHLGLVTADEIMGIQEKIKLLAEKLEETIDIDGILALAQSAEPLSMEEDTACEVLEEVKTQETKQKVRIAVAKDEAFCFIYQDNMELLQELGCDIVYFSPIHDEKLPEGVDGLLLYGGYPELYAKQLSENTSMRTSIKEAIQKKLPTIAECGGFMYLHDSMENAANERYPMVGAIPGNSFKTSGLRRFGYISLEATKKNLLCDRGQRIKAHEFHYWDSEDGGSDFIAHKAGKEQTWDCVHANEWMYAGYPHIHFYTNTEVAKRFVEKCKE